MARKKRGRPRSEGKLKKCPRCGKMGYPVVKTATVRKGGKTYTGYKQQWFGHYSSERFKSGRLHMVFCYIPKAKKEKKVKAA